MFFAILRKKFSHYRADQRGNVLILFAFSIFVLMGLSGGLVDVSLSISARSKVQEAVDTAAAQVAAIIRERLENDENISLSVAMSDASAIVTKEMYSYFGSVNGLILSTLKYKVVPTIETRDGVRYLRTTATASVSTQNHFLVMFGKSTTNVSSEASVLTSLPSYVNITFLLDTSQSMGIAGSPADVKKTLNDQNVQCMFACHDQSEKGQPNFKYWNTPSGMSNNTWLYYQCNSGITTRLDDARTALSSVLGEIGKLTFNKYAVSLMTFGAFRSPSIWSLDAKGNIIEGSLARENCPNSSKYVSYLQYNNKLTAQTATNPNLTMAKFTGLNHFSLSDPAKLRDNIVKYLHIEDMKFVSDLDQNRTAQEKAAGTNLLAGTELDNAVKALADLFSKRSGLDGSSANKAKQYVVILSDGAQYRPGNVSPATQPDVPIDPQTCAALKSRATVIVIYTPIVDLADQSIFPQSAQFNVTRLQPYAWEKDPVTNGPLGVSFIDFLKAYGAKNIVRGATSDMVTGVNVPKDMGLNNRLDYEAKMRDCATSPSYFYSAGTNGAQGVSDAFNAILKAINVPVVLDR